MATNLSKSASPSEPRTHNFLARIERAQVLGGLLQSQENLLDDLHKYFAAEPRRDEREAQLTRFDVYPWLNETIKASGWNVGRLIQLVEAKGHLEDLADTILAWQASRASAALPETANEILQTLKFAKEVIDDQVARFHEGCRCQLCESLSESLQRAIELLESSKISAVPQPSAGQTEGK